MRRHYDENNSVVDEELGIESADEFEGFAVVDGEGVELERPQAQQKKKDEDDGEMPEASAIPLDEIKAIIDNPKLSGLEENAVLTLVIEGEELAYVCADNKRVGTLKSAFVKKLLAERSGQHAECLVFSITPLAMIKIKFYPSSRKNTSKVQLGNSK